MSRFFSEKYRSLVPYTPGEQPTERKYIKLNTNESPFPPSEKAVVAAAEAAKQLQLYPVGPGDADVLSCGVYHLRTLSRQADYHVDYHVYTGLFQLS